MVECFPPYDTSETNYSFWIMSYCSYIILHRYSATPDTSHKRLDILLVRRGLCSFSSKEFSTQYWFVPHSLISLILSQIMLICNIPLNYLLFNRVPDDCLEIRCNTKTFKIFQLLFLIISLNPVSCVFHFHLKFIFLLINQLINNSGNK